MRHRIQDLLEEEGCLIWISAALPDSVQQRVLHLCTILVCQAASAQLQAQARLSDSGSAASYWYEADNLAWKEVRKVLRTACFDQKIVRRKLHCQNLYSRR